MESFNDLRFISYLIGVDSFVVLIKSICLLRWKTTYFNTCPLFRFLLNVMNIGFHIISTFYSFKYDISFYIFEHQKLLQTYTKFHIKVLRILHAAWY